MSKHGPLPVYLNSTKIPQTRHQDRHQLSKFLHLTTAWTYSYTFTHTRTHHNLSVHLDTCGCLQGWHWNNFSSSLPYLKSNRPPSVQGLTGSKVTTTSNLSVCQSTCVCVRACFQPVCPRLCDERL